MQCPDCGGSLDEQRLQGAICPHCLEPLVGILTELRKDLGIEEERPLNWRSLPSRRASRVA